MKQASGLGPRLSYSRLLFQSTTRHSEQPQSARNLGGGVAPPPGFLAVFAARNDLPPYGRKSSLGRE